MAAYVPAATGGGQQQTRGPSDGNDGDATQNLMDRAVGCLADHADCDEGNGSDPEDVALVPAASSSESKLTAADHGDGDKVELLAAEWDNDNDDDGGAIDLHFTGGNKE